MLQLFPLPRTEFLYIVYIMYNLETKYQVTMYTEF
jgi:hypothetical protein